MEELKSSEIASRVPDRWIIWNLGALMKRKGFRQHVLAERAGMTAQQLSDTMHGRRCFKAHDVYHLAQVLGVTVGELYRNPEEYPEEFPGRGSSSV